MTQGISLPAGRTSSLKGLLQAVFAMAAQQVGGWMLIQLSACRGAPSDWDSVLGESLAT